MQGSGYCVQIKIAFHFTSWTFFRLIESCYNHYLTGNNTHDTCLDQFSPKRKQELVRDDQAYSFPSATRISGTRAERDHSDDAVSKTARREQQMPDIVLGSYVCSYDYKEISHLGMEQAT